MADEQKKKRRKLSKMLDKYEKKYLDLIKKPKPNKDEAV